MTRRTAGLTAIVLAALTAGVAGAGMSAAAEGPAQPTSSQVRPETLARARVIRAHANGRYRLLPGRKLSVTEATTTAVVDSLTLVTDWAEFRVVPAENGIYFAICSARARCPYPGRSASWSQTALSPRRLALELSIRTFLETSASLVVVALPTAEPVWVVFERDDLLAAVDGPAVLAQLMPHAAVIDAPLRELIDRLTRSRLFIPLPILPPPSGTIFAASVS